MVNGLTRLILRKVLTRYLGMNGTARLLWYVGMIGSVAAALAGSGLPEPYNHYVMLIGTVSAAITGYQIQHPPPKVWTDSERLAFKVTGDAPLNAPPRLPSASR